MPMDELTVVTVPHSATARVDSTAAVHAWTPRYSPQHKRYYFERRSPTPETSWTCADAPREWNCSEQERTLVAATLGIPHAAAGVGGKTPLHVLERLRASSRSPSAESPFANGSPASGVDRTPPHKSTSSPRRPETPGEGERSALYAALQAIQVARDELARQGVIDAYAAKQQLSIAHDVKKALERRSAAELAALTKQYNAEIEAHDAEVERFMAHRAAMAAERVAMFGVVRAEAAADVAEARASAATSAARAEKVHMDEVFEMRMHFKADVEARVEAARASLKAQHADDNNRRNAKERSTRHAHKRSVEEKVAKVKASHEAELGESRGSDARLRRAAEQLHRHATLAKALADDQTAEIAAKNAEIEQLRAKLVASRKKQRRSKARERREQKREVARNVAERTELEQRRDTPPPVLPPPPLLSAAPMDGPAPISAEDRAAASSSEIEQLRAVLVASRKKQRRSKARERREQKREVAQRSPDGRTGADIS